MQNDLYVIGGIFLLGFGVYTTRNQVRKIKAGKQDQLGFDYKLLGGGVMAIMAGVAIILKYL